MKIVSRLPPLPLGIISIFVVAFVIPTAGDAQSKESPSTPSASQRATNLVKPPFRFRTLVAGTTTKAEFVREMTDKGLQGMECNNLRNDGVEHCSCSRWDSDKREASETHFADFYKDQLSRYAYYFDHDDWESFANAFRDKYGAPSSSDVTRYQNVMGAVFEGQVMTWQRERSHLILREYAGKLTQSNIMLVDEKLDAIVQRLERQAEAQDNKRLIE